MKKLIVLMLLLANTSLSAFEGKFGDVIDAKCSNAMNVKFKYIGPDKDGKIVLLINGELFSPGKESNYVCNIHFKDKDGFSWDHETIMNIVDRGIRTRLKINEAICIPDYAFEMAESTELQFYVGE